MVVDFVNLNYGFEIFVNIQFKMKVYHSRMELAEDVQFIRSIILNEEYRNHVIHILFNQWMETSSDSPWYDGQDEVDEVDEVDAATSLVKISEEGKSSEWSGQHTIFHDFEKENGKRNNKYYNLRTL